MVNLCADKDVPDPMTSCLLKTGVPEDTSRAPPGLEGLCIREFYIQPHILGFLTEMCR